MTPRGSTNELAEIGAATEDVKVDWPSTYVAGAFEEAGVTHPSTRFRAKSEIHSRPESNATESGVNERDVTPGSSLVPKLGWPSTRVGGLAAGDEGTGADGSRVGLDGVEAAVLGQLGERGKLAARDEGTDEGARHGDARDTTHDRGAHRLRP